MIMIVPTSQVLIQVPSDSFRDPNTSRVRQRAYFQCIYHIIGVSEWLLSVSMSISPATRKCHPANNAIPHNI